MASKKQTMASNKPILDMDAFVKLVYERTVEWGRENGMYPKGETPPKSKYSDLAQRLAKALDDHNWGGHDSAVRECFEIVTEMAIKEKLPPAKSTSSKAIKFKPGTILFILSDPMGKGLPVGEPVLITKELGEILTKDVRVLSFSSASYVAGYRLPTVNEVEDLLTEIQNNAKAEDALLLAFTLSAIGKK